MSNISQRPDGKGIRTLNKCMGTHTLPGRKASEPATTDNPPRDRGAPEGAPTTLLGQAMQRCVLTLR